MPASVLILTRDPEVRTRLSDTMRGLGWEALDFADGSSAFLYACGRVATLEAALIDEAIGPRESDTLVRRLRLLRPDLRTLVFRRRPSGTREDAAAETDGTVPSRLEQMGVELRRARPPRAVDRERRTG